MYGLKLQLPDAVTDTSLPKLYADPIMSEGSLYLMDLTKSIGDSGEMLVHNGRINNVAASVASVITGVDESLLHGRNDYANVSPTSAIFEITTKKGLHGIISKANAGDDGRWVGYLPDAIKTWLLPKYATKKIYTSIWGRVTRVSDTANSAIFQIGANSSNYTTIYYALSGNANSELGTRVDPTPPGSLGNFIRNSATGDAVGTIPSIIADFDMWAKIGPFGAWDTFEEGKSYSMIIYRMYVEDLDVSGRTYAEVDALDNALYTTAFASGGKFFDDTFTDPSVLP